MAVVTVVFDGLPAEHLEALQVMAARTGTSVTEQVRQAISVEYATRRDARRAGVRGGVTHFLGAR